MTRSLLWSLTLLILGLGFIPEAHAQPAPSCPVSGPSSPFLGESATVQVAFSNSGTAPGFVPSLELFLPAGVTLTSADMVGLPVTLQNLGTMTGAGLTNPRTAETVFGPVGTTMIYAELPASSLTPSAPAFNVDITYQVANTMTLGTPVDIDVTCLFALGADAVNNPGTDPPLRSDVITNPADQTAYTITPSVVRVTKTTSDSDTATGPNFPFSFSIVVDVANGASVSGINLTDAIDDRFLVTNVSIAPAVGTVNSPVTLPSAQPGGVVDVDLDPLVGSASATDVTVTITGYVPQLDRLSAAVIDPVTGVAVTIPNSVLASGGTYTPPVGPAVGLANASANASFNARSFVVRQTMTDLNGGGFVPGDTVRVTNVVQISDYFTYDTLILDAIAGDGTTEIPGTESPLPVNVIGSDPTTHRWSIGTLVGNEVGGTRRTYVHDVVIDEQYANAQPVHGSDVIAMSAHLSGYTPSASFLAVLAADAGDDGDISISQTVFTKSLIAVNGTPPGGSVNLVAGDVITFRLHAAVSSGDLTSIVLTDYVPPPLLDAQEHGASPAVGSAVSGAPVRYGPNHDAPPGTSVTVTTTALGVDNSIAFDFVGFETDPSRVVTFELDLEFTVRNNPSEDGLAFSNLLVGQEGGTAGTSSSLSFSAFVVNSPDLVVTHGAVASNAPAAAFSPAVPSFPYSSTSLATTPVISNLTGVDAGDTATFEIVVENQGTAAAYDVVITETLPANLPYVGAGLTVTDGAGNPLAFGGDLFGAGLTVATIPGYHATDGSNIVVITVPCDVQAATEALEVITGTARVTQYASQASGANYLAAPILDASTVTALPMQLAAGGGSADVVVRDVTARTITITVPEGVHGGVVLADALDAELAYVATPVVTGSPGVTWSGSPSVAAGGQSMTLNLGTVTNTNRDNGTTETIVISYDTVVLNVAATNRADLPHNDATLTPPNGSDLTASGSTPYVREPGLSVSHSPSATTVDGDDKIVFTVTIAHNQDPAHPAYDAQYVMTLPTGLNTLDKFTDIGPSSASNSQIMGNTLTVDFNQITDGNPAVISFEATVDLGLAFGATIPLAGTVTWTSQSLTPANGSAFNAAALERTGAGGVDDYTASNTANLTVASPSLTKTIRTGGPTVKVGDVVQYEVTLVVPEGTGTAIDVVDTLPNGLVFVSDSNFNADGDLSCSVGDCEVPTRVVSSSGHVVTYSFGNITNANNKNNEIEDIVWRVNAFVANEAGAANGATLVNGIATGAVSATAPALTVQEPTLALTTTLPVGTVDNGDTRTVTVRLQEIASGSAVAYDAVVTYTIPTQLSFVPNYQTGTCPAASTSFGATSATFTFASLADATDCTFSFDVSVNPAQFGSSLAVAGNVTWTSVSGPLATTQSTFSLLAVERTGNPADVGGAENDYTTNAPSASFTVAPVAIGHTLQSAATVRIGDLVTHRVSVDLPEGSASSFVLQTDLPSGLLFVQDASLAVSVGVTCDGGSCASPTRTVTLSGQRVTWDFGNLVNGDTDNNTTESMQIDIVSAVSNVAGAAHGSTLAGTASIGAVSTVSPNVTVEEPTLTIGLSTPATEVDSGDPITFTVTLQEVGTGAVAAYEPVVTVPLPSGVGQASNYQVGTCPAGTATLGASSAAVAFTTLSDAASCSFTFDAVVQDAIVFATDVTVTGQVQWTSFPGDLTTTQSTFGSATERTGSVADPGGVENDYLVSGNATVVAPTGATVTASLVSTSATETTGNELAMNEQITFDMPVTVPEGTASVALVVTPPTGIQLISVSRVMGTFAGTTSVDPTSGSLGLSAGQAGTFSLGTVVNPGNNSAADDTFTLRMVGRAVWATGLRASPSGQLQGDLQIAASSIDTAQVATTLVFGSPSLAVSANDTTPASGDSVDFTVTMLNGGTGPACNTAFTLDVPAGFTLTAPGADGLDNDFDISLDAGDPDEAALQSGAGQGRFVVGGCVFPAGLERMVLRATADSGIPTTAVNAVGTLEAYDSLGSGGTTLMPASDGADTDLDTTVDEAQDEQAQVTIYPTAPQLTLVKVDTDLNGASLEPGDIIRYVVTVQNLGNGAATNVVVTDPVPPANTSYVTASESASAGSVSVAGNVLTASLGTIAAGGSATVRFDVQVGSPLAAGTLVSNQASLAADLGYGGQVSDDPSTIAADDATVATVASTNDTDGDGVPNGSDTNPNDANVCADADGDTCDDCSVAGVQATGNDGPDADSDGLCDAGEAAAGSNPADADSDDDGLVDGSESSPLVDSDGDGLVNVLDPDSDNDGIFDGTEAGITTASAGTLTSAGYFVADANPATQTDPIVADSDGGGLSDGSEDTNRDGAVDVGEGDPNAAGDDAGQLDTDGDGWTDAAEANLGTDPADRDSDDDGVADGLEANPSADTDGDGLINLLDADSDDDGLFDGTEVGITAAGVGTAVATGAFIADEDGATTTSALLADTDGGGVDDGAEDPNHNGQVDVGELDPNASGDDVAPTDTDNDGLTDAQEATLGTSPTDADSDDDGVLDGAESNPSADTDGDGLINPLDPDADDDGLFDGTELGVAAAPVGTNVAIGVFIVDADPGTTTFALVADSDRGGVRDGAEDVNRNGQVDAGDTDPNLASDDSSPPTDTDGDGLPDAQEVLLGSNPNDVDSDDDGVADGAEVNFAADTDGDGLVNVIDADSDGDGLFDGTELGVTSPTADTNVGAGTYVADVDAATTTSMVAADTDGGGLSDGAEDANRNGRFDVGETDPNLASDDADTDGDGVSDVIDGAPADPNLCRDVDADSCDDCAVTGADGSGGDVANDGLDTDADGQCDAGDTDDDGDGVADGGDAASTNPNICRDLDGDSCDDCSVTGADGSGGAVANDGLDTDADGLCDAGDTDDDGDGVADGSDSAPLDPNVCRDTDGDTCDDCILTGADGSGGAPANDGTDTDSDGLCDAGDPDNDNDGRADGADSAPQDPLLCGDTDADTCDDCAVQVDGFGPAADVDPAADGTDTDADGLCDAGDTDDDGDGVADVSDSFPLDSNRCRDLDADGCDDCAVTGADGSGGAVANDGLDTDGDGLCNAGDGDDDGDGVSDVQDIAPTDPNRCFDVDADSCDDCAVTGADGSGGSVVNDGLDTDGDGRCDAGDSDDDDDGVADGADVNTTNPNLCRDLDGDTCDDCTLTGADRSGGAVSNDGLDTDGDGQCDAGDVDDDGDGVADGADSSPTNPNLCRDADSDGCDDCVLTGANGSGGATNNDGLDTDADGLCDSGDADDDGDGVPDGSDSSPLNANLCRDLDGDTCDDCAVTGADGSGGSTTNDGLDTDGDGICNATDGDADNDGVVNASDSNPTNANVCRDLDADGCDDCAVTGANGSGGSVANDGLDTDGDGICNASDPDSDNDGVVDASDTNPTDANVCRDTDSDGCDDCAITGADGSGGSPTNDGLDTDGDGLCDAGETDDDGDGVLDLTDALPLNPFICRDTDGDGCDDCSVTGADGSGGSNTNDGLDTDGDGRCDVGDLDDDSDGVPDASDSNSTNPNVCADADSDGCDDCAVTGANLSGGSVSNDGLDTDGDGQCDAGDLDDDNDGVPDGADSNPTNPNVCRDVDADGCDDCSVTGADGSGGSVSNDGLDTDGDGVCDAADTDTDGDGVTDAGDSNPTNPNVCQDADADTCDDCSVTGANGSGGSVTNDGLDTDGDGACDAGDPDDDADGVADGSDSNTTNPNVCADADADLCDDCAVTGANNSGGAVGNDGLDTDGDGLCNVGDADDDGDGVLDLQDTDPLDPNVCRDTDTDGCDDCAVTGADGSGGSVTNDGLDTDGDGTCDLGDNDNDNDGVPDTSDSNPNNPSICADADADTCDDCAVTGANNSGGSTANDGTDVDGDGLCDAGDPDDDNDGVPDGTDSNPTQPTICADADGDGCDDCAVTGADGSGGNVANDGLDTDGDGQCDAGDPDTDSDGVPDGADSNPTNPIVCADADGDTCDDCAVTAADNSGGSTSNDGLDTDGDGLCDAGDPDDDDDGVPDGTDSNPTNPNVCADADTDTCDDCAVTGADRSGGSAAGDGLDTDADGQCDAGDSDDDDDGVFDVSDSNTTNPNLCRDVDADSCDDCAITGADRSGGSVINDGADNDGDGQCDVGDTDDDNDGVPDLSDSNPTDPNVCRDLDADTCDDCAITGANGSGGSVSNDGVDTDGDGQCDAGDLDADGDGVVDASDSNPNNPNLCRDLDADTCDDCAITGANGSGGNVANDGPDLDGDGQCDASDTDRDNDGVPDTSDSNVTNPNVCADADTDGCDDCGVTGADNSGGSVSNDGPDNDGDGQCDVGDIDDDNDGVPDTADSNRVNANVCADADADTCDDCAVTGADNSGGSVSNDGLDNDGDGQCDAGDSDDDNDGVVDGSDNIPTDPNRCRDVDSDGCDDCAVTGADNSGGSASNDGLDTDADGVCDAGDSDDDNDGVPDVVDTNSTNPNVCADADADTCDDCAVTGANRSGGSASNDGLDTDLDGQCDAGDPDDDGDGVLDGVDTNPTNPNICADADGDGCDDCVLTGANGSGGDVAGDGPDGDGDGLCDSGDADTDNDGVIDGADSNPTNPNVCADADADGCDDCAVTGADLSGGSPANDGADYDADGQCDAGDTDDDNDGVPDTSDANPVNANVCSDVDRDGCDDCVITGADLSGGSTANDGADFDADGICDAGDLDDDDDGVLDTVDANPMNANVCRDADADGCDDCVITGADRSGGSVTNDGLDTDADGLCDAGDADDDDDGVPDGADSNSTNPRVCADVDGDSCDDCAVTGADRSGGSVSNDGLDTDGDGACDAGDPDDDADGVPDGADSNSTNPNVCADADGDSCDDCAVTGANNSGGSTSNDGLDTDGDGLCDAGDTDDDGDGVLDGADSDSTNPNVCADADADTCDDCAVTGADGSGGSVSNDGADTDGDGQCDLGDSDDDNDGVPDTGDSMPRNPNLCRDVDADTCDDCAVTGADGSGGSVSNDGLDTDADGQCNASDLDDDNDGVPDITDNAPTNANVCRDVDTDGCDDCAVTGADGSGGSVTNDGLDTDGDGSCDAGDLDDDNDGVPDGLDSATTDPFLCRDIDLDTCDDCSVTGANASGGDPANDGLDTDGDRICDASDPDDDADGVLDVDDSDPVDPNVCADADADSCDDCAVTGADGSGGSVSNDGPDVDGDGICDVGDIDVDNDGVANSSDPAPSDPTICGDVDADTCDDCAVQVDGFGPLADVDVADDGPDLDADGLCDAGDPDIDGDGVLNVDDSNVTDPSRCADVDADGCDDCALGIFGGDPARDGPDGDGDGQCDSAEDRDGDGIADHLDLDADGDGIPDTIESRFGRDPYGDADADGIFDYVDADERGDGLPNDCLDGDLDGRCDELCVEVDADGDGVPNHLDVDSDDDGIVDAVEAGHGAPDADGNGQIDGAVGVDGLADAVEVSPDSGTIGYVPLDTDADTIPDFLDVDSDGDGTSDVAESGQGALDGDGDGRIDDPADLDRDGLRDVADLDSAAYGFPGLVGAGPDTDGDGIPDVYDAAGDGPDAGDSNGDGLLDDLQCPNPPGWPRCPDLDRDGTPNYSEPRDTDGDGVHDARDVDSDDDGVPDALENDLGIEPYGDADGDGISNFHDADDRGDGTRDCADPDGDGLCNTISRLFDTDGDGVPNHLDLDSDGDGLTDNLEAGLSALDADRDGLVDGARGANGWADAAETTPESGVAVLTPPDLDADGVPDMRDLDTDGDGIFDVDEVPALRGLDGNDDGRVDGSTDLDRDGIAAPVDDDEAARGFPGAGIDVTAADLDGDGIWDLYDASGRPGHSGDSDGDGLLDDVECPDGWPCPDSDGDGVPDFMDARDSDGDGVVDGVDVDTDGDGIPDAEENIQGLDPGGDVDGDGIVNMFDADDRGDGYGNDCSDADDDGMCERPGALYDVDGDGVANHLDLDADGDGIFDIIESDRGDQDADGDGRTDGPWGENGLDDDLETRPESGQTEPRADTDSDGTPDFLDVDSDGDGVADRFEVGVDAGQPADTDGDGSPDYRDRDSDDDGILDADEAGHADLNLPPVDTDGDGLVDMLDLDSDDDGLTDSQEAGDTDVETPPRDTDGDGIADYRTQDSDGDGVLDGEDKCPTKVDPDQADTDGDGVGDACDELDGRDRDGDGFTEDLDNCPEVDNRDQVDTDGDGLGDACDPDADGDGLDDDHILTGGGCQHTGSGPAPWPQVIIVWLALFGILARGRRNNR